MQSRRKQDCHWVAASANPARGVWSHRCRVARATMTLFGVGLATCGAICLAPGPLAGAAEWSSLLRLVSPGAMVRQANGSLFIVDNATDRVVERRPSGALEAVAGSGRVGYSGDGGRALSAALRHPAALALAPDGRLFIADAGNDRVRVVSVSGTISTYAGDGQRGWTPNGALARRAPMGQPLALALDRQGDLYVATSDNEVFAVTPSGRVRVIAGVTPARERALHSMSSGDGGPAVDAAVNLPDALAFGPHGELYIGSWGAKSVRVVDQRGIIRTLPGTFAPRIGASAIVSAPTGDVYLASGQVLSLLTPTRTVTLWNSLKHPVPGIGAVEITGIAAGPAGSVYVDCDGRSGFGHRSALISVSAKGKATILWAS